MAVLGAVAAGLVGVEVAAAPANDMFANRTVLEGRQVSTSGSNVGATSESGEVAYTKDQTVWWSWTASVSTGVTISTAGSAFDTVLTVYTGSSLAGLTEVRENDDAYDQYNSSVFGAATSSESRVEFFAIQGTEYQIRVAGYNGASGAIALKIDSLYDSGVLPEYPSVVAGTVGRPFFFNLGGGYDSVTATGLPAGLSVAGLGHAYDWSIGGIPAAAGSFAVTLTAMLAGKASPPVTVLFVVGTGRPPVNDDFANRVMLTGLPVTVSGHNELATDEHDKGEPFHDPNGYRSVWWSWKAPVTGPVRISTGQFSKIVIAVYTGDSLPSLQLIRATDTFMNSTAREKYNWYYPSRLGFVDFQAEGGTQYHIAVVGVPDSDGGLANVSGSFDLRIRPLLVKGPPEVWDDGLAGGSEYSNPMFMTPGVPFRYRIHASRAPFRFYWWFHDNETFPPGIKFDPVSGLVSGTLPIPSSPREIRSMVDAEGVWGASVVLLTLDRVLYVKDVPLDIRYPPNDSFAQAKVIAANSQSISNANRYDSNVYATLEAGEPAHGGSGSKSLWWRFKPSRSERVRIATAGSEFDTVLAVYTGSAVSNLTLIAANDDAGGATKTSRVEFIARQDTEYLIAVAGVGGASGPVRLSVLDAPPTDVPEILGERSAVCVLGNSITHRLSALNGPVLGFTATGLPEGLELDPLSGTIRGTPKRSGVTRVTLEARNYLGVSPPFPLEITVIQPPVVTTQPAGQTVPAGQRATFSVEAAGTAPLSYQWYRDGVELAGATAATYTIEAVKAADAGAYTVAVLNVANRVNGVAAGGNHSLFIEGGALWAMGDNSRGQLGDGTLVSRATPIRVASDVAAVAAGKANSFFVTTDGTLWGMGDNAMGQLGDGTLVDRPRPVRVAGDVVKVSSGALSGLFFLKKDGTLWSTTSPGYWSEDTTRDAAGAWRIAGDVIGFAAGPMHLLFVKADGTLWGVGVNLHGQLGSSEASGGGDPAMPGGSGTPVLVTTPVKIATGVIGVHSGDAHTVFVKSDRTLWGLGSNAEGQSGVNWISTEAPPVLVAANVVGARAGNSHTLFLKSDATLWGLGANHRGQLGDGTTINRFDPVQVATGVTGFSGGDDFTLFTKADGSLWVSGRNSAGELGVAAGADIVTPQRVPRGTFSEPAMLVVGSGQTMPVVTWTRPAAVVYGTELSSAQLNAAANVPGTFQYRPAAGTVLAAGEHTLTATFTPTNTTQYKTATASVQLTVLAAIAPSFTVQPQSQVIAAAGGSVTFTSTATGSPAPAYQWYFNGAPVSGATDAALTRTNVQPSAVGRYWVVATNSSGTAASSVASLEIKQSGNAATHAVVGSGYVPGAQVTIKSSITYAGSASKLSWAVLLPPGWSYVSSSAGGTSATPRVGQTDILEWLWSAPPVSPVAFSFTLNVPAGQVGVKELVSLAGVTAGQTLQFLAQPDPLVVAVSTAHSADLDQNGRIALVELTRVIELYNTANGTSRTGCYAVTAATNEDGFVPAPERLAAAVTLGRYHSADFSRDGKIDLNELTRVIGLYNYRSGTTRTGQYRVSAGTEDGFAPGP